MKILPLTLLLFFQEGLLERNEFLTSFIEILEKYKQTDDTMMKLSLAQILQVMVLTVLKWF